MDGLRAELLRHVYSPEGPQAELVLIEPNGTECWVRFLYRPSGPSEIYGDQLAISRLHDRYGQDVVRLTAQQATLG